MSVRRTTAVVGTVVALAVPSVATAASAGASPAHHASHAATIVPTGGVTMLRLNAGTAKVLAANKIKVAPVSEARVVKSGIAFPIQGGLLNAKTLAGTIKHDGGLRFSAGGKSLTVRDFTIRTKAGRLTGYVDQVHARVPILNLHLGKAKVAATAKHLSVSNVRATLNKTAAKALDSYFGTTLFKGGLLIGTARVSAKITVLH